MKIDIYKGIEILKKNIHLNRNDDKKVESELKIK